jgi:hypothetical protein
MSSELSVNLTGNFRKVSCIRLMSLAVTSSGKASPYIKH